MEPRPLTLGAWMGQDGTVYRKFKYGLLDDDNEDDLEYDDESYSYQ